MNDDDLLSVVLRAVKEMLLDTNGHATDQDLLAVEKRIRLEYCGCRVYIGGRIPADRRYEAILNELASGVSEADVAERHEVSSRTIRRARRSGQRRP